MSRTRKNNRKTALLLSLAFALIIAGAAGFTLFSDYNPLDDLVGTGQESQPPEVTPPVTNPLDAPGVDTPEDPETPEISVPVVHNFPEYMRAVTMIPGVDFFTVANEAAADVQKEIDDALNAAAELTMNTVIVGTSTADWAIYESATRPTANAVFDAMQYIIDGARTRGMYVYCLFDLKATYNGVGLITYPRFDTALLGGIETELGAFVQKYSPDGIFFTNYDFPASDTVFADYLRYGAGMSYDAYLNNASYRVVELASEVIRDTAPGIQVGLLAHPQWATQKEHEDGINTLDPYSSLTDGHSDVRAMLQDGLADMVAVEAYGSLTDAKIPFARVIKWWSELAEETDVRMYAVHAADRMANSSYTGWGSSDQMTKQCITLEDYEGCSGSIFNGLGAMKKDPAGSVTLLMKYFRNEVNTDYIMTELSISSPTKQTYSTYEPTVLFRGASDPTNPVTVNGKEIKADDNGYFSVSYDLKPGLNTFTFVHKDKTVVYKITRNVKIFQSVSPVGTLTVDGNTELTLTAMAYEDAVIVATINGQSITLTKDTGSDGDDTDRDSFYVKYTGVYTTPAATNSVRNLGNITFKGTWQGIDETETGASVKVNKLAEVGDGSPVIITASQAETFPTNTLDNLSDGNYYPLPKGALDYTVGEQIVYTSGSNTYRYYKLASGLRVYASDLTSTDKQVANVVVEGMSIVANSSTTTVMLNMSQPTSYSVSYSSGGISFTFNYLKSTCGSMQSLTKNPIFSSAVWSGDTLTLKFRKSNGMCGYTASYNGNTLSLKFNNPPSDVSNARIVIDPGHGGTDVGALGFYPGMHEDYVNRQIATELAAILRGRGADVLLIDTSGASKVVLETRVAQASAFNPQIFLSVHCNSATNPSAIGNEAYYFYDFSKPFASYANNALYSAMGNANRGAKYGLYYVTRTTQYSSVLAECGFMSNQYEYLQLLNNYQTVASSLANSVGNYISSIYSGYMATGTETVGKTNQIAVTGVKLNKTSLTINAGETAALTATVSPADATDPSITWSSSNTGVVTVDAEGKLTAVAPGTAQITVKTEDGNFTAVCTVTVKPVAVTSIALDKTTAAMKVGETLTLTATVAPENATDKTITWKSSNTAIVDVNDGMLTALKAGTATITATSGSKSVTCKVTVTAVDVTEVTLDKTTATLAVGDTLTLKATVLPENATDKAVTWKSSSDAILKVENGVLTALKEGTATVTATCGGKSATCTVTVQAASVPVTGITLDLTSANLTVGKALQLVATLSPAEVTDKTIEWQSSAAAVATVDAAGKVTAVSEGTATITASCEGFSASCTVTVGAAVVETESITLSQSALTLTVGESASLSATVLPSNATDQVQVWNCSDFNVASIDGAGSVTAIAEGTATITVTCGGKTATCTVTVQKAATTPEGGSQQENPGQVVVPVTPVTPKPSEPSDENQTPNTP